MPVGSISAGASGCGGEGPTPFRQEGSKKHERSFEDTLPQDCSPFLEPEGVGYGSAKRSGANPRSLGG